MDVRQSILGQSSIALSESIGYGSVMTINNDAPNIKPTHRQLGLVAASVFIVGEVAGSGVVSLPFAVAGCGWTGVFLIGICCLAAAQSAIYLGKTWSIIEERWPEYKNLQATPYAVIGLKAVGPKTATFVWISVYAQLYGVACVFLSLGSLFIESLLQKFDTNHAINLTNCELMIVLGVLMIPLMWLPTPAEIKAVAWGAMGSTAISCILLLVMFGQRFADPTPIETKPLNVTANSFFFSFGSILFVYGGACTFPTYQNFMKEKQKFHYAVIAGFTMILLIYISIAASGFALFQGSTSDNILNNLPDNGLRTAIFSLMIFHLFAVLLIVINVVNLALEAKIGLSGTKITLGKCIFRTLIGFSMIIVVLTIPKFTTILGLVGALTASTTSFIFPPLFYLILCRDVSGNWPDRRVPFSTHIIGGTIGVMGLVAGILATYSSVADMLKPDSYTKPCYV